MRWTARPPSFGLVWWTQQIPVSKSRLRETIRLVSIHGKVAGSPEADDRAVNPFLFLLRTPTRRSPCSPVRDQLAIMSIFNTWMYNGTGGSLLIAALLHAATTRPLTAVYAPAPPGAGLWTFNAMLALVAVGLIARTGAAT